MATLSPDPLPREPGELLKLGLSLIERAYDERARGLEAETARLRAFSAESEGRVTALQQRVSELEAQLRSGAAENASLVSERASLAAEKSSLAAENRSLQERLDKAGQFKRAIMSIAATNGVADEEPPPPNGASHSGGGGGGTGCRGGSFGGGGHDCGGLYGGGGGGGGYGGGGYGGGGGERTPHAHAGCSSGASPPSPGYASFGAGLAPSMAKSPPRAAPPPPPEPTPTLDGKSALPRRSITRTLGSEETPPVSRQGVLPCGAAAAVVRAVLRLPRLNQETERPRADERGDGESGGRHLWHGAPRLVARLPGLAQQAWADVRARPRRVGLALLCVLPTNRAPSRFLARTTQSTCRVRCMWETIVRYAKHAQALPSNGH